MTLRRILTVLTGKDCDQSVLSYSQALCVSHDASLDALFVRRNAASGGDFLGDGFSTYGMEAVLEAIDDAAAAASARAHKSFEAMADEASPALVGRFIEYIGMPAAAIVEEGRLADLIVVGKPEGTQINNQMNALEIIARESGRPVLAVPTTPRSADRFRNVTIAWDGSLEAAHAVAGSMLILQSAQSVTLLHAGIEDDANEQLARLSQYLEMHDIETAIRTIPLDGRTAAKALIETSAELATDLMVMGGFGAPGWLRMLGRDKSTCLLKDTPFAILLAH
jgi:nucleotide-binding universal stress UspA family protein